MDQGRRPTAASVLRRVLGFYGLTAAVAVSPLVALPAVASTAGADGLASVAVGQSVGTGAGVVIGLGFGFVGVHAVARLASSTTPEQFPEALAALFWTSAAARLVAAVLVLPVAGAVAFAVAPTSPGVAATTALAGALSGLSNWWVYTGLGRSGLVARYEALPQVGSTVLAAVLLLHGMPLAAYPAVVAAGYGCSITLGVRLLGRPWTLPGWRTDVLPVLRSHGPLLGGSVAGYLSSSFSVVVVGLVAPVALPVFAAVYRLHHLGKSAVQPIKNALQSWAVGADPVPGRRRRRAVAATSGVGLVAGLVLVVAAPVLDDTLFAGVVVVRLPEAALVGGALAVFAVGQALLTFVLVPAGRTLQIAACTTAGAVVGMPAVALGAWSAGAVGACAGVLVGEVTVAAFAVRVARSTPRPAPAAPTRAPDLDLVEHGERAVDAGAAGGGRAAPDHVPPVAVGSTAVPHRDAA